MYDRHRLLKRPAGLAAMYLIAAVTVAFWAVIASSEALAQQGNRPRLPECYTSHSVGNWRVFAAPDFATANPIDIKRVRYQEIRGLPGLEFKMNSKGASLYVLKFSLFRAASVTDFEVTLTGSGSPGNTVKKQAKVLKPLASDAHPQELELTDLFPAANNPLLVSPNILLKLKRGGEPFMDMEFSSHGFREAQAFLKSEPPRLATLFKQKKCTLEFDF